MKTGAHHHGMPRAVLSPLFLALFLAPVTGAVAAGCSAGHSPAPTSTPATGGAAASATATGGPAAATATGGGAAGNLDPCAMLTTDQVAAALGQPPAPGKREPNFDAPQCQWDPASGQNGNVVLEVGPWDGNPGVKPLRLGPPVSGVGDAAYDGGNTGLYIRKGAQGVRVWVFNVATQSSRLDLEKQLAAIVLAQL
jgi:uncharacterized protein DUF3558